MNPAEVVESEVQGDCRAVVLEGLRKTVRQPRKPAHPHPHREILTLHVGGADFIRVGCPDSDVWDRLHNLSGAVPLRSFARRGVNLHELREVHSLPNLFRYGSAVRPETIRRQLKPARCRIRQLFGEFQRVTLRPSPRVPRNDQFRVPFNGHEGPVIADLISVRLFRPLRLFLLLDKTTKFHPPEHPPREAP